MASSKISPFQPGFIRLANASLFSEFVRRNGVDPSPAYRELGLEEASPKDRELFIHAEVFYALTNSLADLMKDKYLGVAVGAEFSFSDWPPFANAIAASETLGQFLTRYIQMVPSEVNSVAHSLLVEADYATYSVARPKDPEIAPIQVTGFGCAQYLRVMHAVTGDYWDPTAVQFRSKYTSGIPRGYMQVDIVTSRNPGLEIKFPTDWLYRKLATEVQKQEDPVPNLSREVTIVTALRAALRANLYRRDLDPVTVAGLMGLDADLLVAALKQNKTTLPREVKKLKVDRAKEILATEDRTITEIGAMLGYDNNAHFTRFFRSQTGTTPSAYRASLARK